MYKVPRKTANNLPSSLDFAAGKPATRKAKTTYEKWQTIIAKGTFPSDSAFSSRYKQDDIKDALKQHYQNKCAYCEQYVERWDVEHYRPKKIYYWLAYSWDNLLLACPTCNQNYKGDHFKISQQQAQYTNAAIQNIHCLCESYNELEKPALLHPEFDILDNIFSYDLQGHIFSQNTRGQYTIKTCGLNRKALADRRKEIVVDHYKRKLQEDILLEEVKQSAQEKIIIKFIQYYVSECKLHQQDFIGFRYYVKKHLLNEIIKLAVAQ